MASRRRAGYWLLALTYLLTTALVDGGHRHGRSSDERTRCERACQAPGAHLSGHDSPDLTGAHHDCPACQFRTVQVLPPQPLNESPAPLVGRLARRDFAPSSSRTPLPSTVRGPPALA